MASRIRMMTMRIPTMVKDELLSWVLASLAAFDEDQTVAPAARISGLQVETGDQAIRQGRLGKET
jgi:hypothetical protein